MFDGGGLYLQINPNGGKLWRFKFRFGGQEKLLALGVYPVVSLKEARDLAIDAKRRLSARQDPCAVRKAEKTAHVEAAINSFEAIAREWYGVWSVGKAPDYAEGVLARFERDIFPRLGALPIKEITAPVVLDTVRKIEARGCGETATRAKNNIGQVMRYAIASGKASQDPTPALRGAMATPTRKHFAAITEPVRLGELLRSFDGFTGTYVVRAALLLSPLLWQRPGEVRRMRWAEVDLEAGEWRYFVGKTKTEHLVPLSRQAVEILRELWPITGRYEYVFPNARNKHGMMSNAAVNSALRRLGWDTQNDITGHGFRATARTMLAERLNEKPEVIEHQLAHKVPDILGSAYNRTKYIEHRRRMMQIWADYLDGLKLGAKIMPFKPVIAA
jgi:integrase